MNLLKLHKTFTEQKETSTWSSETNKVRQAYEKHPDNVKIFITYYKEFLRIHGLILVFIAYSWTDGNWQAHAGLC